MNLAQNAVSGSLVGDIGCDHRNAESHSCRRKRIAIARHDCHFGTMFDQRLNQSKAKTAASAGDENFLVFQVHRFCSIVWM